MAEKDPGFDAFVRRWTARLGASERDVAMSYLPGEAMDAEGYPTLKQTPDTRGIFVRVDGRGVDGMAEPGAFDDMIAEWEGELEAAGVALPERHKFTKRFIERSIALSLHEDGERKVAIACDALWMAAETPGAINALREPGGALLCQFTYDEAQRATRMQLAIIEAPEEETATG
jgi:hypothetical protein